MVFFFIYRFDVFYVFVQNFFQEVVSIFYGSCYITQVDVVSVRIYGVFFQYGYVGVYFFFFIMCFSILDYSYIENLLNMVIRY